MTSVAELVAAGAVRFDRLAWAAQRAPRPILFGAAVAAGAGMAAFIHFTGFVPGAGATGFMTHVAPPRPDADR